MNSANNSNLNQGSEQRNNFNYSPIQIQRHFYMRQGGHAWQVPLS